MKLLNQKFINNYNNVTFMSIEKYISISDSLLHNNMEFNFTFYNNCLFLSFNKHVYETLGLSAVLKNGIYSTILTLPLTEREEWCLNRLSDVTLYLNYTVDGLCQEIDFKLLYGEQYANYTDSFKKIEVTAEKSILKNIQIPSGKDYEPDEMLDYCGLLSLKSRLLFNEVQNMYVSNFSIPLPTDVGSGTSVILNGFIAKDYICRIYDSFSNSISSSTLKPFGMFSVSGYQSNISFVEDSNVSRHYSGSNDIVHVYINDDRLIYLLLGDDEYS